jgi:uncharacterized YigZ family protein
MSMSFTDTYKTINSPAKGTFREKGSRFIALASPVCSIEEVKIIIEEYKKKYHNARHHSYAYLIGHDKSIWRANDDGEPSGTAGKPILGQINSHNLSNILIVVIRYFGGTLLGVSGLINAYRSAAADAIANSEIVEKTVREYHEIRFPYARMNEVMKILKDENISQTDQVFEMECIIKISFRLSAKELILKRFSAVEDLSLHYIETH